MDAQTYFVLKYKKLIYYRIFKYCKNTAVDPPNGNHGSGLKKVAI